MTGETETRLPWGKDTITIKGRNSGIEHLTVYFDDDQLNIVDFLNNSLMVEYAALYEEIMSRYEAKLKTGTLFDHGFPEAAFPIKKITPSQSAPSPAADKELIEALLKEYNVYLAYIKEHFREYETKVEEWCKGLPEREKKV